MKLEDLINNRKSQESPEETADTTHNELQDYFITDPQVVGYPDEEMQSEIYKWAAANVLPIVGSIDIVDIGAGRGDFGTWIRENYPNLTINYDGFEQKSSLVQAGKLRGNIGIHNKTFAETDTELSQWNGWAFCIGSINEIYEPDKWKIFFKILRHSLNWVRDGVVFILNESDTNYTNYPPAELLTYLKHDFPDIPYQIDSANFNGIYKLVIYNKNFGENI